MASMFSLCNNGGERDRQEQRDQYITFISRKEIYYLSIY